MKITREQLIKIVEDVNKYLKPGHKWQVTDDSLNSVKELIFEKMNEYGEISFELSRADTIDGATKTIYL